MADRTIGDLPAASQLLTADLIPIEQGGNAKRISGQIFAEYAREKAQQAASGYATAAAQSAADAEAAAALAEAWSAHPPYIGQNGNWYVWNTTTNQYADSGVDASITVTIADIEMIATTATPFVTNTGTDTDPIFHLHIPVGTSITGVQKTGTSGLTDTYTISYSNNTTSTFTITNGSDGVSPEVTIASISGGHRVTITDKDHPSGQSFDVIDGSGAGDMVSTTYDPNGDVAFAGGIPDYVEAQVPTTAAQVGAMPEKIPDDNSPTDLFKLGIEDGALYIQLVE